MNDREALHTAARRYSMERESDLWEQMDTEVQRQSNLLSVDLRRSASRMDGLDERLDVIQGILRRIEGVVPATFPSVDALGTFLRETAKVASLEEDTRPLKEAAGQLVDRSTPSKKAQRAGPDERARFQTYIESLQPENLTHVTPLPHRRLLSEREAEDLWQRLARTWRIPSKGYWWPLGNQRVPPPHVLDFNDSEFDEHVPLPLLTGWLREARARPIIRFDNDNPGEDYELDLDFFALVGAERYWTTSKMDWVIYVSHESSITIGGEWLLNLVKEAWPEWDHHHWSTYIPPESY